jgi:hypothetical protein
MDQATSEKASFPYRSTEAQPLMIVPKDAKVEEAGQPRCSRRRRILPVVAGLLLGLVVLVVIYGCEYLNILKETTRSQQILNA